MLHLFAVIVQSHGNGGCIGIYSRNQPLQRAYPTQLFVAAKGHQIVFFPRFGLCQAHAQLLTTHKAGLGADSHDIEVLAQIDGNQEPGITKSGYHNALFHYFMP